jgi:flavin-binding protein dodecin
MFTSNYTTKELVAMTTVAKIIELVGESDVSWDDAMRNAVKEASKTVDNITGVEVVNFTVDLDDGKIIEYKVNMKLAFGVREYR